MACPLHPGWSASEDRALKFEAIESERIATTALLKSWMDHYQTCCDGRGAGGHTVAVTAPGIGNGAGSHEKQRKRFEVEQGKRRPFQAAEEAVNRARGDAANVAPGSRRRYLLVYWPLLHHGNTPTTSTLEFWCLSSRLPAPVPPHRSRIGGSPSGGVARSEPKVIRNGNPNYFSVHSLVFLDSDATQVEATQWRAALVAMRNLKLLFVCRTIPLPSNILPAITFRLKTFGSTGLLVGEWAKFVISQDQLERLWFDSDFFGHSPRAVELPALWSMKGCGADLARFARYHHLRDLWFFMHKPSLSPADLSVFALSPSQLSDDSDWDGALFEAAGSGAETCDFLDRYRPRRRSHLGYFPAPHQTLPQRIRRSHLDNNGGDITGDRMKGDGTLAHFATVLDRRFPYLRSVKLVFKNNQKEHDGLLGREDGKPAPPPGPFRTFLSSMPPARKNKMRSHLPTPLPPRPAPRVEAESPIVERQALTRPCETPESQGRWDAFAAEFSDVLKRWADGEFRDDSPCDNRSEEEKERREKELEVAWDNLMSQVMDWMTPWEKREWRAEERRQEEREARYELELSLSWADSSTPNISSVIRLRTDAAALAAPGRQPIAGVLDADGRIRNVFKGRDFIVVIDRNGVAAFSGCPKPGFAELEVCVDAVWFGRQDKPDPKIRTDKNIRYHEGKSICPQGGWRHICGRFCAGLSIEREGRGAGTYCWAWLTG
ncbi:hypothetical protein B0H14DRAFT_3164513, partial [Mycena olivaceomarginata]